MYEDEHLESAYEDMWDNTPILNYSDLMDKEAEWNRYDMSDEAEERDEPEEFGHFDPNQDEPIGICTFDGETDYYRRSLQSSSFGNLI